MKNIFLSIVIPAYNEADRINRTLPSLKRYLEQRPYNWEIILIPDGSSDNTAEIAKQIISSEKIKVLENKINKGKGLSVRRGVFSCSGKYILITDADLSTPIEEVEKLLEYIKEDYDIAIGSRALAESLVEVHQSWYREKMGKIFNFLVRLLVMKDFVDTQCGFKCLKRTVAWEIFSRQKINGFAFDVELLLIAKRLGKRIKEVPIRWIDSVPSRVHIIKGSLKMFCELMKIKFYDIKGYYSKK